MAKKSIEPGSNSKQAYPYPSRFGSHKSMVIEYVLLDNLGDDTAKAILEDEHGTYITDVDRLDSGLADPNRHATSRLTKLFEKSKDKKDA